MDHCEAIQDKKQDIVTLPRILMLPFGTNTTTLKFLDPEGSQSATTVVVVLVGVVVTLSKNDHIPDRSTVTDF